MREVEVTAVTVSYRCAALTIQALQSLAVESSPGVKLRAVVVDNDSGDLPAIQQAVESRGWSSWVTLVAAPRNGGFAYGNNIGFERACIDGNPDYFYLLNPDAEVRTGAVGALVRFLEQQPRAGIAGSSFENPDGSLWPISFRFPGLLSELDNGLQLGPVSRLLRPWTVARSMSQSAPQPVDWICGASMLIRSLTLHAIGGFDENYFLYFEETDFCRRARAAGWTTWYVPDSRVMHIMGQSTNVTDLRQGPKRLPGYWFESRRRYFQLAFGTARAGLIDLCALLAGSAGLLKKRLQGRSATAIPHYLRDLARHSILRSASRRPDQFRSRLQHK